MIINAFIMIKRNNWKIILYEMRNTALYMRIARDDPRVHRLQIRYDFPRNSDSQTSWRPFMRHAVESSVKKYFKIYARISLAF